MDGAGCKRVAVAQRPTDFALRGWATRRGRANGSRERAPDDRLRETHRSPGKRDGFRCALPILQTFIVRPICPTGGGCGFLSIGAHKNISVFQQFDRVYGLPVPHRQGAYRDRHGRGAECGGRVGAVGRAAPARTAKSCGPGAPMLGAKSLRIAPKARDGDGGKQTTVHRGDHV